VSFSIPDCDCQGFISIEGGDGAGKTTQIELLSQALESLGRKVKRVRDPGGTLLGDKLRSLLLDRPIPIDLRAEALLFFASRAQLVSEQIKPALKRGDLVLTDRFTLSTVIYQGHAGGLDPADLWHAGALATGGIEPSLCFLLDIPPENASGRRDGPTDHMERKPREFHEKVRSGFLAESKSMDRSIHVLDAREAVQSLHKKILERVLAHIGGRR
jgi:dTMP kinase